VIDKQDERLLSEIENLGIPAVATDTIMLDTAAKAALARKVLAAAGLG
jgi:LPPG:FO 2-phospho-L-lactate transferase